MYYCFFVTKNGPIFATNNIVLARKKLIKAAEKFPMYEWSGFRMYISTDSHARNVIEEIRFTKKVWLTPNAYPSWGSKKTGSDTWREIVVEGSGFGQIVGMYPFSAPKKTITKKY